MSEINEEIQTAVTIRDIGSLDKSLKSYDDYVRAGRALIKNIVCHQARIAYYSIKICTIRHGGISKGVYTISDYASDIGMNKKTLQEWTLVYRRVIQHLDKKLEDITEKDWKVASRVAWIQDQDNRLDNREKGTPRKMVASKPVQKTPEQIKQVFKENYEEKSFKYEAVDWSRSIMRIKNLLLKRDLSLPDERTLEEIMENCDQMSDHINDYLTKAKKGKK